MCQYPGNSSPGLKEWENDFVSAKMEDNGNSEYSGFVNPVLGLSDCVVKQSDTDQQIHRMKLCDLTFTKC